MHWIVAQVVGGREEDAEIAARDQGYIDVILPQTYQRMTIGKRLRAVPELLFPGYLFVLCDISQSEHAPLVRLPAVTRILPANDRPRPIPAKLIAMWRRREAEERRACRRRMDISRPDLAPGDIVTSGAIEGRLQGIVRGEAWILAGDKIWTAAASELRRVEKSKRAA